MSGPARKVWDRPPSLVPAWLRAATGGKAAPADLAQVVFPRLDHELWPQKADPRALQRYRRLCGFVDGPFLPPTYPQLMAGVLHIHMLTDPAFPLPVAGLVHVRNVIDQARPIGADHPLHFSCHLAPARQTAKGVEIDLVTVATVHGEAVWRSVITALARAAPQGGKATRDARPTAQAAAALCGDAPAVPQRSVPIRVAEDTGRRYAALAGDYNPIHLHATTAKLFGFPRAIAHGMWSLGRCVGEIEHDLPPGPLRIEVQFRRPLFLPSVVVLSAARSADGVQFALHGKDGATLHLDGRAAASGGAG